jgi:hypothetical protein
MKATHPRPPRGLRKPKESATQTCQQALRVCESSAASLQAAGEELAASWTALCYEISTGVSCTELLRKRAWCNVLELRLKEQAHALEQARHGLDTIWDDVMLGTRARELFNRLLKNNPQESGAGAESLPLLAKTASAIATAHRRSRARKEISVSP